MVDFLDASDWADVFWIIIFFGIIFSFNNFRNPSIKIFKQLFSSKFIIIYACALTYIFGFVLLLKSFNFWDLSLLKDTLLWLLLAVTIMMYNIVTIKIAKYYFIDVLNDAFKWAVTIEFIVGLYSSSFWFEFFFVPISIFCGAIIGVGEKDNSYKKIVKFVKWFVIILGLLIFIYRISRIVLNYSTYLNIDVLKQFMLVPVLTLSFLPFLYLLFLYVNYEIVYTSINNFFKSKRLRRYTKLKLFWKFKNDISGLKRVRDEILRTSYYTKESVNLSILKVKVSQKNEKNPPQIDPSRGWSPYTVKDYLKSQNLSTGYYFNCYDDDWFSASDYLKLDDNINSNLLAYYINGSSKAAKSLKLILNINNFDSKNSSHGILLSNAKILYTNIFETNLPSNIATAIEKGFDIREKFYSVEVSVEKIIWSTNEGYHITFEIQHISK